MLTGRIYVQDETVLEYDGGKSTFKEMKMLEKMLAEQPPVPMTLMDMYHSRLNEVNITSYPGVPLERYISFIYF